MIEIQNDTRRKKFRLIKAKHHQTSVEATAAEAAAASAAAVVVVVVIKATEAEEKQPTLESTLPSSRFLRWASYLQ